MSKNAKQRRPKCVYCGKYGVSFEHFLGDWMLKNNFSDINSTDHVLIEHNLLQNQVLINGKGKLKRGNRNFFGSKLRIACEECNNTWMSEIQNNAKNPIMKFINGDILFKNDINYIFKWCILHSISSQHTQDAIETVPFLERYNFSKGFIEKNQWGVWVARVEEGNYWHKGTTQYRYFLGFFNNETEMKPVGHITCTGFKGVLFLILKFDVGISPHINIFFKNCGLVKISTEGFKGNIRKMKTLTDRNIVEIISAFTNAYAV